MKNGFYDFDYKMLKKIRDVWSVDLFYEGLIFMTLSRNVEIN